MDLPSSVCDHGFRGFWKRIFVASVTARAGLSDACAISYIQYIGVVSAGLTSATSGGAPPNSPIGIYFLKPLFASQHSAEYVPNRQCTDRYIAASRKEKRFKNHGISRLFAALKQRAMAAGAAQQRQKDRKRADKEHHIDRQRPNHQVGPKHLIH